MCHGRSDVMKRMELAGWQETLYPGITFIYGPRKKNTTRYELSRLDSAMTDITPDDVADKNNITAPRTSSNSRLVRGGSGSSSFVSSSAVVPPVTRSRLMERQTSSMSSDGVSTYPIAPSPTNKDVIRFDESIDPFESRTPSSPQARSAARPPSFEDSASSVKTSDGSKKKKLSFLKKMYSNEEDKIEKDDYDWL